jgi:hypothetical protein
MNRLVFAFTVAFALLLASPAFAGPYLNTAAMLLREGFQSAEFVRANLGDRDLARVAHVIAEARMDAAAHLTIPKEVERAHPHFLLALASLERATDAVTRGDVSGCLRHIETARGESRTFRALLEQQRLAMPTVRECSVARPDLGANRSAQTARRALRNACARFAVDPAGLASRT